MSLSSTTNHFDSDGNTTAQRFLNPQTKAYNDMLHRIRGEFSNGANNGTYLSNGIEKTAYRNIVQRNPSFYTQKADGSFTLRLGVNTSRGVFLGHFNVVGSSNYVPIFSTMPLFPNRNGFNSFTPLNIVPYND